ncbi:hypothetical protein EB72_08530 [Mycobacterium sp. SWH-M1]|nr:hypothetical protein EB72_08530 [Mycobacterium sp. SWH-M1]
MELVTCELPIGEFTLGVGQRGADAVLFGAELVQWHGACVVRAQHGVPLVGEALDLPFRGPDALVAVRE